MSTIRNFASAVIVALSLGVVNVNATPVTLNHIGTSGISGVVIEDNKIDGKYPVAGKINVGQFTMQDESNNLFGAFCADIFNYIKGTGTYEAMTLAAGGLSSLTITRLAYLFGNYPVADNSNVDNAVFQATLWEILFEKKPKGDSGLGLSKGTFEIDSGFTKNQRKVADKMIKDVFHEASKPKNAITDPIELTYWKSLDGGQDLISWSKIGNNPPSQTVTVPEPGIVMLLGLGLLAVAFATKRREEV